MPYENHSSRNGLVITGIMAVLDFTKKQDINSRYSLCQ